MSERAIQLSETADRQIVELADLFQDSDDAALRLPCPGREKLGDGTVGALARHTADNYRLIAEFVAAGRQLSVGHGQAWSAVDGPSQQPPPGHTPRERGREHAGQYTAGVVDLRALTEQLSAARHRLARIGELTDAQLDAVPPSGSFRFCDGQRTLEQVLSGLFKHQRRQIDALKTAVA